MSKQGLYFKFIIPSRTIMVMLFSLPDSSSGCLKASSQQGAIDVYISQLEEVALTSEEGESTGLSVLVCNERRG